MDLLKQLNKGIYIPEYDVTIPWLIEKSDLKKYIPIKDILYSKCDWVRVEITLLGIKTIYNFSFSSYYKNKLGIIGFESDAVHIKENFKFFNEKLIEIIGEPNCVIDSTQSRWEYDNIILNNSIWESTNLEGLKSKHHTVKIQFYNEEIKQHHRTKSLKRQKPYIDKVKSICNKNKISVVQYEVLSTIDIENRLEKDQLARVTKSIWRDDLLGDFELTEYQVAVENCIEKGWLRILTKEHCEQDKLKWMNNENECCSWLVYNVDDIDFTEQGYLFYKKIKTEINNGLEHRKPEEILSYNWPSDHKLSIFARNREELIKHVEQLTNGTIMMFEENEIKSISSPLKVSEWWLNRFEQVSNGWRIDIIKDEQK